MASGVEAVQDPPICGDDETRGQPHEAHSPRRGILGSGAPYPLMSALMRARGHLFDMTRRMMSLFFREVVLNRCLGGTGCLWTSAHIHSLAIGKIISRTKNVEITSLSTILLPANASLC